ncbi:MAG: 5-oxoprolinase [Candidatus Rokuibacteriota bacterium]|nr:MAG: 5-oxoprolinase [Candidatus Rokubacteria bacterium]
MERAFRIGIDTGGTFTDVVALNEATGEIVTTKTPTTVDDPSIGVAAGIRKVLDLAGGGTVTSVAHGTTVATNALLHEQFPALGLVTTQGFRHVLEIARQAVPKGYGNSYFWVKPERIVPLHHVREVPERLDVAGGVVRPFDEAVAVEVARWFVRHGITNVGVSFIHAYANPEHERRMRAVLERESPSVHVSISSEVLPEYREYERTVTTLVDAFVKSRVAVYVGSIQKKLDDELAPATPFYVMKSNGGVISAHEVARHPITTVLSGPAAGALGASAVAAAASIERVLTADVGGTSTDVCLVEGGAPELTTEGAVGRFPVKVPMIDIVTVGSGGGSIAWIARDGALKVGPRSAGADPGPMCYGRGGDEPTATDAHLALGRIPPRLLGGEIALDRDAAERGLARIGHAIGLDPLRAAEGILEIAAWNQANAIRQVSVKRGLDPRDYTLVAFGGAGALLAGRLLDLLSLRAALIPVSPGNLSALGLLVVDVKNDYVQTFVQRHDRLDHAAVNAHLTRLRELAREALHREGFTEDTMRFVRTADMRYFGQAWEVRVELPPGEIDGTTAAETAARFHDAHEKRFGYSYRDVREPGVGRHVVEWVNVRVTGVGPIRRPCFVERASGDGRSERAVTEQRPVRFEGATRDCAVYARDRLRPDDVVAGPAIIEEYGATTVVFPGLGARVDRSGNLLMTRASGTHR